MEQPCFNTSIQALDTLLRKTEALGQSLARTEDDGTERRIRFQETR